MNFLFYTCIHQRLFIKTCFAIVVFVISFNSSRAQEERDFAQEIKNAIHDTVKCDVFTEMGENLYQDFPDSALQIWNEGLKLAEKNHTSASDPILKKAYLIRIAAALNNIAAIYMARSDWDQSIAFTQKSLTIRESINDKEGIANCLNNLGMMYVRQGNMASASEAYFKCLKISEQINDSMAMGHSYLNIGSLFYRQGELDEALVYFNKALIIREKLNDKKGMASVINNIGVIYDSKKDYKNSLKNYLHVLEIYQELDKKRSIAETYNNIGNVYNSTLDFQTALTYYKKAFELMTELNFQPGLARVLTDLSKVNANLGHKDEALQLAEQSLDIALKTRLPEYIRDASEQLKTLYETKGNYKKALEMYALFIQNRDSINSEKTRKASLRAQYQFEFDKKEALLLEEQAMQKLLAEEKNNRQKAIIWAAVAGLLLVVVFSLILYSRLSLTKRQKKIIDKKNEENELLLSEIHHRVKNNLQVISSLLSLQERSTENEGAKSAIQEGKERVKSMELVHKLLYQNSRFSGIEMHDYVNKLTLGLLESFGLTKNEVQLNTNVQPITLDVDTAVPLGLILNELIVNSLKYAKTSTDKLNLKIELHLDNINALHLNIADNGKGKISDIEKSNSFGLKIVKALIRQLDGVMEIREQNGIFYHLSLKNYKLI